MINYQPILPKTSHCESILVLDLTHDKFNKTWEAKEALIASTTIQGIVNRTSNIKLYFINYPNEHFWNPPETDLHQIETLGFFPVPYIYAKLDTKKKYPVLSYLMNNYGDFIKGKVIYPALSESVCDGAVMAALTVCGQTDSVMMSPAMDDYIKADGLKLSLIEDTTGLSCNIDAFKWSKEKYFTAFTTRAFIGQHSYTAFGGKAEDQFPSLYDYYIANKAFVFCLNGNVENEKTMLSDILNEKCYPYATPVIGLPVDEGEGLKTIESEGYYFIIANVQNLSCTSSFSSDPSRLEPQPEPKAAQIRENGAYVAFYVTDGDSMAFSTVFHYDEMKNFHHFENIKVPVGWSFSPLLLDIYPSFVEWTWKLAPDRFEMISDWHDQNYGTLRKSNEKVWNKYCKTQISYLKAMGIYTTNDFEADDAYAKAVRPYYQIKCYQGEAGSSTDMSLVDGIVTSSMSGKTQCKDIAQTEYEINCVLENIPEGQPAFIMVCIGDGRAAYGGGDIIFKVKNVMDRLLEKPGKRDFNFMMPKDLAATFKNWQEGK
ncbi:MAG TPA: hypothetical protein VIK78_18100 [Ruminiclostridium sp.]